MNYCPHLIPHIDTHAELFRVAYASRDLIRQTRGGYTMLIAGTTEDLGRQVDRLDHVEELTRHVASLNRAPCAICDPEEPAGMVSGHGHDRV